MSDNQQLPLSVQPVISYPREAQVGKTYLMTIDLQPSGDGEWLYEEEEYPIYCMLDTSPLFSSKPVGEPAVVLHRFGGSYGAAKFLLTATQEEMEGEIRVTLVNGWGVPVKVLNLPNLKVINSSTRRHQLLSFLQGSEQHLSIRTQVRKLLLHERKEDFDSYLNHLRELLTNSNIRFHIKQAVFALLATMSDPTEDEWHIISPLIGNPAEPLTQQVWRTLRSSVHWFQLLDSLGIIKQWLKDESEERIDQTVMLLSIMQRQIPDRVAELVEPYIGVSESWRKRLSYIVQGAELSNGNRFFRLFLRLINEGIFDQTEGIGDYSRDFWMQIYSLPKQHPDWACEAIGCYLNRHLDLSIAAGHTNPFDRQSGTLPHSQFDEHILSESATNAPRTFIEYILPFMLRLIELTARKDENPPWSDTVWQYRPYGKGYDLEHVLLSEMEVALFNMAANHPEDFSTLIQQRLHGLNFETIQFLLIRAYAANAERFADEAIDYLCEQPARLETGYSAGNGNIHAAPYWATRQLIESTTPHCSQGSLLKLEEVILNYYSEYEKTARGRWFRGYPQLVLLDAIALSRRTEGANRRLQEWKRKFTDLKLLEPLGKIEPPESTEAYIVSSPIPETAADKMTDEQWLTAIAQYDYNDFDSRIQRNGELMGGAHQLSSLLESAVKKEPARFASLIWQFPNNANSAYFDAVLRGIAEVSLDVETALRVCQRCHQLPQRPCGRSICWLILKLAKLPWPQEALDLVIWYALEDPDPEQELWRTEASSGRVYYGGNILQTGINSTRGSAVEAIAKLIFSEKNRAAHFQAPLQQIVQDSSIAVRACAAEALTAMLNYNRDLSISLFYKLCETEDVLLGTQTIEYFLHYVLPTHFEALKPIIERMINSDLPEVVKVGARQACIASLEIEAARPLADYCLSGTEAHRLAASEIFAANLHSANFRTFCETALVQLFYDSDEKVRSQSAKCFSRLEEEELGNYISLVNQFIQSPAFANGFHDLVWALEKTTAKLPETIYLLCEHFIKKFVVENADSAKLIRGDVTSISQLLVRAYSQTEDQKLQTRCLDLIDSMAQIGVYGLDKALEQYEI